MITLAETLLPYWKPLAVLAAVGAWLAARRLWPAQVGALTAPLGWTLGLLGQVIGLGVRLALVVALSVAAAWWAEPAVEVDGQTMSRARYALAFAQEARGWERECWATAARIVFVYSSIQVAAAADVLTAVVPPPPFIHVDHTLDNELPGLIGVPDRLTWQEGWRIWRNNARVVNREFAEHTPDLLGQRACRVLGGSEALAQFFGLTP